MSQALTVPLRMIAAAGALGLTPFLLIRVAKPGFRLIPTVASALLAAVSLNVIVCVTLHAVHIPLSPMPLALTHAGLLGIVGILCYVRKPSPLHPCAAEEKRVLGLFALLCLLLLPVTHLAGGDTYKWQDLASAAAVERNIPWLMHPLSLFGFTTRSYPSAHPLYLATVQILTGLGVDWGMYVVSITIGALGLSSAYWLGGTLGSSSPNRERFALWFALLYGFSPVFMRYTYWATGRGLFLAVLPLFLVALLRLPAPAAWGGLLTTGLVLPMAHKTGAIALVLFAATAGLAPLCRALGTRRRMLLGAAPFALAAVSLAPAFFFSWPLGTPFGFTRLAISRFAWYTPFALIGLVAAPEWWVKSPRQRLLAPLLLTLPLACIEEMYGAMVALPFVVAATVRGLSITTWTRPPVARHVPAGLAALTLAAALTIVVHLAAPATPRRVHAAAAFIEEIDPLGPFLVVAPYMTRRQIQAYVSGCPRFFLSTSGRTRIQLSDEPLPAYRGDVQAFLRDTIQFTRHLAGVSHIDGDWYGHPERTYYVTIDGEGHVPGDAQRLYDRDGVRIHRAGKAPVNPYNEGDAANAPPRAGPAPTPSH